MVFARWLATAPKLFLLDEPTRGLDVGAKTEILKLILELAAAGLLPADVEIFVEEGPDAGFVSSGLEPERGDGIHRFIVCAAMQPGEFHIACRIVSDGTILARARFRVVAHWPDRDSGPGIVLTGKQQLFVQGSWGGGPNSPQNINTVPAPAAWRSLLGKGRRSP